MKKNVFLILTNLFVISFCQSASAAALTAFCSKFNKEDRTISVLKVVVADDWMDAVVTTEDEEGLDNPRTLLCSGPPSPNQNFKCETSWNLPGYWSARMKFLKNVQNETKLIVEQTFDANKEFTKISKFKCNQYE